MTALVQQSTHQAKTDQSLISFLKKWTPRAIAVGIGGYYGLGIAYEAGVMALIDQIAIQTIKHYLGYAGVGALMPTVQWHAAWSVRIVIGLIAGAIYDVVERALKYFVEGANHYFAQRAAKRDFVRAAF